MQTKTVRTGTSWTVPPLSASLEYPLSHTQQQKPHTMDVDHIVQPLHITYADLL